MKITIDTKEDSHEEIRKIIKMLSSLVNDETFTNQGNVFENQGSDLSNQDMFNMFNNKNQNTPEEKQQKKEDQEIDIDIPDIEEYH